MRPATLQSRFNVLDDMSADDVQALLAGAAAVSGRQPPILRNRHIVIVCEPEVNEAANGVADAAGALGATVVRLHPRTLRLDEPQRLRETARLLGRLYDLIACEGLGLSVSAGLCRWSGVPVLCDVAAASHPTRMLADLLVMQEHAGRPAAEISLGLLDEPDSETFRSWRLASALTGLRLVRLEPLVPAPVAASLPACDYCIQAAPSGGTGPTLRVASSAAEGGGEDLAPRQHDAHRRLLQSVLVEATG